MSRNKPLGVGILLYIVSSIITLMVFTFSMVYGIIRSLYNRHLIEGFRSIDNKFFTLAVAKDQTGNVLCKELFNDLLISNDSEDRFGNEDETISSVLGKNEVSSKLKKTGKVFVNILNWIQPNHCINSINS